MPQQRSPSGQKTPTWPTKIPGVDSNYNDSKSSPQSSSFDDRFLMLGTQEHGASPPKCSFVGCTDINEEDYNQCNGDQSTVKVTCCKDNCGMNGWMHRECFKLFEESTDKLTTNGKAGKGRSWADKQKAVRPTNQRKGSWECPSCSKSNSNEKIPDSVAPVKFTGKKIKAKKQGSGGSTGSTCSTSSSSSSSSGATRLTFQHQLSFDGSTSRGHGGHSRSRTLSLCSAGSSPPNCSDDPVSSQSSGSLGRFEFFADPLQAAVGNIFDRRFTLDAFMCLPHHQQNPYQIKVEDEGPHGNDEIRSFILTTLSAQRVTDTQCCTCGQKLIVFDKYPLIDGTFFLSPLCYGKADVTPTVDKGNRKLFLNAICVECLSADLSSNPSIRSKCLRCSFCERVWSGSRFLMGSMYSYDIFSAVPCCQARLLCNSCRLPLVAFDAGVGGGAANLPNGTRCYFQGGYPNGMLFGGGYAGFTKMNGSVPNGFTTVQGGKAAAGFGVGSLKFFSDYSKKMTCPHCNVSDHHFVKPLLQVFYVRNRNAY